MTEEIEGQRSSNSEDGGGNNSCTSEEGDSNVHENEPANHSRTAISTLVPLSIHNTESKPAIRLLSQRSRASIYESQDAHVSAATNTVAAGNALTQLPTLSSPSYYTSVQWTANGTSLIASSSDHIVSTFVLPADLLQPAGEQPRYLQPPQKSIKLPEPAQCIAIAPYFSLAEPVSQIFLVGCRDHPLHLYHALPPPAEQHGLQQQQNVGPLYTYKLIRKESEEYITPSALLWEYPGTHFLCGSTNRLDYFDVSRYGSDGPLLTIPTIPSKRHSSKGGGVGMKGTVAALAASPYDTNGGNIIAAGTWTRWMGMYDLHRSDKVVANWSIADADASFGVSLGGQGIVQTLWSPCGRYLVINERQADGLLVYDIRGTGQLLSILKGRKSTTQQRLHCDVFQGDTGFEVWAGSQDGSVLVWEGVGTQNDVLDPSWAIKAHEAPVGSVALHSSGSVLATCSGGWSHSLLDDASERGSRTFPNGDADTRVFGESSLKIWSIEGQQSPVPETRELPLR